MIEQEFLPRTCSACGMAKNELRNGKELIKRCKCDYFMAFDQRVAKTVNYEFLKPDAKSIKDWSPKIFKEHNTGQFKTFIKVQKALCINRIYEFAMQAIHLDPVSKIKSYAIQKSIEKRRNLYIRGPNGSGRDLLMSTIKMLCAQLDISTTPNPADWAIFKSDTAQCNWNGKEADEAKERVAEQYKYVKVLALTNVRGENSKFPHKGATYIDEVLARRSLQPGSIVLTAHDFIGQLTTFGDNLHEIFDRDSSYLILMFSSLEADHLLGSFNKKMDDLEKTIQSLRIQTSKKQKLEDDSPLDSLKELLYIEHFFPNIPSSGEQRVLRHNSEKNTSTLIGETTARWSPETLEAIEEVTEVISKKGLPYEEAKKSVYLSVVNSCQSLASKMTEKEKIHTASMLKIACGDQQEIKELIKLAKTRKENMLKE